jgi:flagella synthesis protein FlgN
MSTLNPHAVQSMIAQDSSAITELKSLLLRERELLEQRQHAELPLIIERKDQLLDALGYNAKQRASLLQAAGFKASPGNWEIFLGQNATTRDLLDTWRSLMGEFAQCKSLNEINGKMIGRSKQTLGHLLNLLRGQVAAPQLYNSAGATTSSASSRCVAEA